MNVSESESHSVVTDSLPPHGICSPWNSPGQNTAVDSLFLFQGIFPTQGSNPGLPHCRQILYQLSYEGSQGIYDSLTIVAQKKYPMGINILLNIKVDWGFRMAELVVVKMITGNQLLQRHVWNCKEFQIPRCLPLSPLCMHAKLLRLYLTLCNPMNCILPGSSVHGILQTRIWKWVAISSSRGDLPDPGIEPASFMSPALAGRFFTTVPPRKPQP